MEKKDRESLEIIKKLIEEVKREMKGRVLTEGKTPQKIFENHRKNMKEYILGNVWNVITSSTK